MTIKGCIFDLDGVIVDTAKYHYIAWRELAHELGFLFTEKDNERLKGVSRMKSLEILLEVGGMSFSESRKKALAEKKNKRYVELINQLTPEDILPGARLFIENLKTKNIKTALGSASKNAMTILNKLEITNLFESIIDGTKVSKAKPDPEVFLKAAQELDLNPEECIVFEDAQAGIEAAKNGKMWAVAVGKPENLSGYNAIISSFSNITFDDIKAKLKI